MIVSAPRLVEMIRDSNLLDGDQLATLTQTLQSQYSEASPLANELVRRGWLTAFQLKQIEKGIGHDLLLGPYTLLEPVATGGMGHIYKAKHRQSGKTVAVKVIRKDRRGDIKALSRFRREVQAMAQLRHPNIVTLCDVSEFGVAHYYAMEFVDGVDLEEIISQTGRMPVAAACDYVRQAALGLQHAHERGLIHRDIKPGNLLIGRHRSDKNPPTTDLPAAAGERFGRWGQVKLLDLGLVLLQETNAPAGMQGPLTQQGFALGTVDYMAPEQVVNPHAVDIRADLYSLGCTFYEMLTGHVPFPKGSPVQKLVAHRTEEPVPIQQVRPEVPSKVAEVLTTLLAKQPTRRYQTPGETAEVMADLLIHLPPDQVDLDWQPPTFRKGSSEEATAENPAPATEEDPSEHGGSTLLYVIIAAAVFLICFAILFRVL